MLVMMRGILPLTLNRTSVGLKRGYGYRLDFHRRGSVESNQCGIETAPTPATLRLT
ncbi:MAG: hypothetical protein V7641_4939 [Blastocatellia bacterium]